MTHPVVERDDADPVYVDAASDGRVELRIGKPIQHRFQPLPSELSGPFTWAIPKLLQRGSSLSVILTPAEARIVAHSLLAAAERAGS
jgi:hypothetical protein